MTDPRKIHAWWTRWPDANIGMPSGVRSGVWVLDVDRPDGLAVFDDELPKTPRIRTLRGGVHFPFRHVEGVTNSPGALLEGIDVRGEGGFVLENVMDTLSTGRGAPSRDGALRASPTRLFL